MTFRYAASFGEIRLADRVRGYPEISRERRFGQIWVGCKEEQRGKFGVYLLSCDDEADDPNLAKPEGTGGFPDSL